MQNDILDRTLDRSLAERREAYAAEIERLVDAGLAVMQRTGDLDPKVADIVAEAGLSNQAFYRHFRSKGELLLAIMDRGRHQLLEFLERRMAVGSGGPALKIRRWVEGVMAQAANPKAAAATRPFAVNASRLAHEFPAETAASADALKGPLVAALTDAGAHDPRRDADAVYHLTVGRMERHLVSGTTPGRDDVSHLVRFVLRAVGVDGSDRADRSAALRKGGG